MQSTPPRAVTAICHALQEQIEHGLLAPGGKLPAERKLSEVFATTRITLREALVQLEAQGLIYREERRGWFVAPQRLTYDLIERSHFHAMVRDQEGGQHRVALGASAAGLGGDLRAPATAGAVQRGANLPVAAHRWAGGAVCRALPEPEVLSGILEQDLAQSLTEIYGRVYGIRYGQVCFEILPTALPVAAAGALKVSAGSPGLHITRVNSDQHGHLIDCDLEYWRHDAIRIRAQAG